MHWAARGAILDRPETEIDRPETISQSRPTGIVRRSQSRADRSEVSAEILPERPGVAPRPEPEIARPEVEFVPVTGPSFDPTAVGTIVLLVRHTRCGTGRRNPVGLFISGPTETRNSTSPFPQHATTTPIFYYNFVVLKTRRFFPDI